MCVRYLGQKENSVYFPFTETFESFCKIKNEVYSYFIMYKKLYLFSILAYILLVLLVNRHL